MRNPFKKRPITFNIHIGMPKDDVAINVVGLRYMSTEEIETLHEMAKTLFEDLSWVSSCTVGNDIYIFGGGEINIKQLCENLVHEYLHIVMRSMGINYSVFHHYVIPTSGSIKDIDYMFIFPSEAEKIWEQRGLS